MAGDNSIDWMTRAAPAVLVGLVSGVISAFAVEPGVQFLEQISFLQDTLVGFLSILGLTAGLCFGVAGAGFGLWRLDYDLRHAALWFVGSIMGMSAAFYAAILFFDNASNQYVLSYLVGSPVGALILGAPIVMFRPYLAKMKLLASLLVVPTLWAVGVAFALMWASSDDALAVPWLLALFCGWQTIYLVILSVWRRA